MPSYKQMKNLLNGDVQIYILESAKSDVWQVRFRNPLESGGHYVRRSTKHRDEASATRFALNLYNEYSARQNLGLATGHITLRQALDRFANDFDPVGRKMAEKAYQTYWHEYFGDMDLAKIRVDYIRAYFKWRVKNPKSDKTESAWKSSDTGSVSVSTLKLERNLLRRLFNFCKGASLILDVPSFPRKFETWENTHQIASNKRRGRLDLEEDYRKVLLPYLRSIHKGLQTTKWSPQPANPDEPWSPVDNPYESRLKWKNRRDKSRDTHKVWCHLRSRYNHAFFWYFTTLILNSGIRPSEAAKLKHGDITLRHDKESDRFFTCINIDRTVSKVRKHRVAICRDHAESFERYLFWREEIKYRFNREPKQSDWLFPSSNEKSEGFYVERRDKPLNTIRVHMKKIGLHRRTDIRTGVDTYFSAYSFRSFYITMMLRNGLDLYTLSKQVGTSPQTILKQYDVNENWFLRDKMMAHLNANDAHMHQGARKGAREAFEKFATVWD